MSPAPKEAKPEPAVEAPPAAGPEKAPKKEKPVKGKEPKGKASKGGAPAGKAETKPVSDNPNFRYIVRMAGSDLDGRRPAALALTGVHGVGLRVAYATCRLAGVDPAELIGNLPEPAADGLEELLSHLPSKVPVWMVNHPRDHATGESSHFFGPDLQTSRRDQINQMKMIRSYRGIRHERGQKVRGQRTRSNGRTGMAAGVLKKTAEEAQAAAKEAAPAAAPAAAAAEKK